MQLILGGLKYYLGEHVNIDLYIASQNDLKKVYTHFQVMIFNDFLKL